MTYIVTDIIGSEGKKAFYKLVGMESENGEMVNIKVFEGEFEKQDILNRIAKVEQLMIEGDKQLLDYNSQLAYFK